MKAKITMRSGETRSGTSKWDEWNMKTWGCPVQFKDIGLARNKTKLDRPLNAKRDEVTINGYFVGHEGMTIRICTTYIE